MTAGWLVSVTIRNGADRKMHERCYIAATATEQDAEHAVAALLPGRLSAGLQVEGEPAVISSVSERVISYVALASGDVTRWS